MLRAMKTKNVFCREILAIGVMLAGRKFWSICEEVIL